MTKLEIVPVDVTSCSAWLEDYRRSLVAPHDDMWTAFADMAQTFDLACDGESQGFCSVNDEHELHRFFVGAEWEDRAEARFDAVLKRHAIRAALPSTVDPLFLSLSMDRAHAVEVKALQYRHVVPPSSTQLTDLRCAQAADYEAVLAFEVAATGAPLAFLEPYLNARIAAGELLLHEHEGEILGVGELRRDGTRPGCAHLGVVVGEAQRGQGLGSAILAYLVRESARQTLVPVCSTEPTNLGARRAIERAGFRARHRVLRVSVASPGPEGAGGSPDGAT